MSKPKKLRVCVLFGGRSGEHEVSLMSARSVLDALDPQKYEITQVGIDHNGTWYVGENVLAAMEAGRYDTLTPATLLPDPCRKGIYTMRATQQGEIIEHYCDFDLLYPVLHGTYGEDGTIQGLFEMAGAGFVGSGVLGSSAGMDKVLFKDVMRTNQVPVVESILLLRKEIAADIEDAIQRSEKVAAYPLFIKPANLGSSVGVSKCHNRQELRLGLIDAARYDRRILVERGVNAREIEVSVLGNDEPIASVPGEILPSREFYSYAAKYLDNRSGLLIPAPLSPELTEQARELAVRSFKVCDCAGMARVDFLLDKETNILYLNELNTLPGFTKISMYPKLWNASGIPYPELVDRLIALALERKEERENTLFLYQPSESGE